MKSTDKVCCEAGMYLSRPCRGNVVPVVLGIGKEMQEAGLPDRLWLCEFHHQMELLPWGVKQFLEKYPLVRRNTSAEERKALQYLSEADKEMPDPHLSFIVPEVLESIANQSVLDTAGEDYHARPGYDHLKRDAINLDLMELTDKQLTAVCLVFYGGVKKKRAAQAMKISSQALADHVKAALRKIEQRIR